MTEQGNAPEGNGEPPSVSGPLALLVRLRGCWFPETRRLRRELDAAVEYHDNYVRAIDHALGQPRNLDAPILEEHLAAIGALMDDITDEDLEVGHRDTVRWLGNLVKLHKAT